MWQSLSYIYFVVSWSCRCQRRVNNSVTMGVDKTSRQKSSEMFASHFLNEAAVSKKLAEMIEPEKSYTVLYGNLNRLPSRVRYFVEENAKVCQPDAVHICDGSEKEKELLYYLLQRDGTIKPLRKYENCWLAKTDPVDVARVESRTFISTQERNDTVPTIKPGIKGTLSNWMSPEDMEAALDHRFPGCMRGRTMYVIPFSMVQLVPRFLRLVFSSQIQHMLLPACV